MEKDKVIFGKQKLFREGLDILKNMILIALY